MVTYSYYFTDARIKGYVNYLGRLGHKVDVLTLKEPHRSGRYERISDYISIYYLTNKYIGKRFILYLYSYLKFYLTVSWTLTLLWMYRGYDIIHINNIPNFIVFATLLPRIFGARIILDMHDIMSQLFHEKFGDRKYVARLLAIEEVISTRYAHIILCADDFQKDFLVQQRGLPPNKVHVILNLPDLQIFKDRNAVPSNSDAEPFNIVYHGTVTYRLGIDLILKAIAKVKGQIKVKFYLYGAGDYMNDCLRVIDDLDLNDTVHVSNKFFKVENLPELLHGMHLGVIGNRISSATKHMLPVKMMEYMALKIPVVVPDIPNIRYYFNERCVCYYDPENVDDLSLKIVMLARSSGRRTKLAKSAYELIRLNNWNNEFVKYMNVLGTLIK